MLEFSYADVLFIGFNEKTNTLQVTFKDTDQSTFTTDLDKDQADRIINDFRVMQGLEMPSWYSDKCGSNCKCNRDILQG